MTRTIKTQRSTSPSLRSASTVLPRLVRRVDTRTSPPLSSTQLFSALVVYSILFYSTLLYSRFRCSTPWSPFGDRGVEGWIGMDRNGSGWKDGDEWRWVRWMGWKDVPSTRCTSAWWCRCDNPLRNPLIDSSRRFELARIGSNSLQTKPNTSILRAAPPPPCPSPLSSPPRPPHRPSTQPNPTQPRPTCRSWPRGKTRRSLSSKRSGSS